MSFCAIQELKQFKSKQWILSRLESVNLANDLVVINRQKTPILMENGINLIDFDSIEFKKMKVGSRNHSKLVYIIGFIIDNLTANTVKTTRQSYWLTNRDLYYSNVNLLESQHSVVGLVEDLACSMGTSRQNLNLVASQKGMVSGPIRFISKLGQIDAESGPICIPQVGTIEYVQTTASRLLVVEKDATFQALINSKFHQKFPSTILITGKGYPDENSRMLLKLLVDTRINELVNGKRIGNSNMGFWDSDGKQILNILGEDEMDFYESVVPDTFYDDTLNDAFNEPVLLSLIIGFGI